MDGHLLSLVGRGLSFGSNQQQILEDLVLHSTDIPTFLAEMEAAVTRSLISANMHHPTREKMR